MSSDKQAFRKRTKDYAVQIVKSFVELPKSKEEVRVLAKQMLRSGTSVGANYREASRARSNPDFISKIEICAQEADETQYWIELLKEGCGIEDPRLDKVWKESDELISIFVTMSKNAKNK